MYFSARESLWAVQILEIEQGPPSQRPRSGRLVRLYTLRFSVMLNAQSFLASRKNYVRFSSGKTLASALWTLGGHLQYTKLYWNASWLGTWQDWGPGSPVQQIRRPQGKRDSGSMPAVDRDEERKKAAKSGEPSFLFPPQFHHNSTTIPTAIPTAIPHHVDPFQSWRECSAPTKEAAASLFK